MDGIGERKSEHLAIVTAGRGTQDTRHTGFDAVRFLHHALPELSLDEIDTGTTFLGHRLSAPLTVFAMTGGRARPTAREGIEALTRHLSEVVEQLCIAKFRTGSRDLTSLRRAPGGKIARAAQAQSGLASTEPMD